MTSSFYLSRLMKNNTWQFWIDRGGTFTDVVAKDPQGQLHVQKLLSENPQQYHDAVLHGIRNFVSADLIAAVRMGTTVATNALLERKGKACAFVTTRHFADALLIGYQNRPDLFALNVQRPEPIYQTVIEIDERMGVAGDVIRELDIKQVRQQLQAVFEQGIRTLAIVFMHGYRFPQHEQAVADLADEIGFESVICSHQVSPTIKFVQRADTTILDAYLTPILQDYINSITSELADTPLFFMQSNGGLTKAASFRGKNSILSGPAGGVVGAIKTSVQAGFENIISFDMGGTSTDVSHYAGEYERTFDAEIGGVRMHVPMMQIHTVAAGGGSILHFTQGRYQVGPDSAGANPGPACYRQGGPLTLTDCNVMLSKIKQEYFPKIFGNKGDQGIDVDIVKQKFTELAKAIEKETGNRRTPEEVAEGFIKVAVDNMANAIKKISIQRGYDVKEYTLACFGGAGPQHACLIADELGIKKILIHPYASVLSAFGIGMADVRVMHEQSQEIELKQEVINDLNKKFKLLSDRATDDLIKQGITDPTAIKIIQRCKLKYKGTDYPLLVDSLDATSFEAAHQQRYGFTMPDTPLVVESLLVEGVGKTEQEATVALTSHYSCEGVQLKPGDCIQGPKLIIEKNTTIVVAAAWQAQLTNDHNLLLSRTRALSVHEEIGTGADPVMLEVFNNLFMNIAEQMGLALKNTAYSVNIKERLDFSCAIFDSAGQLVANALHIPVHLGSMGESVRSIIHSRGDGIKPGDVFMLNNPYNGGTHLPDITVITPVFSPTGDERIFYVASRAHHTDIGGITPGSVPADAEHIREEGILIDDFQIVEHGRLLEDEIRQLLSQGPYPVRNIEQNINDLKAQIAANEKGMKELHNMVARYGLDVVRAYMQYIQDNAAESVRHALKQLQSGHFCYEMDNGSVICVRIDIDKETGSAVIDFSGTSKQQANSFNAPQAVCRAAVLYVLRTLVQKDIPLNEGCLRPVKIIIPEGSLLNPSYPAPVVAGIKTIGLLF